MHENGASSQDENLKLSRQAYEKLQSMQRVQDRLQTYKCIAGLKVVLHFCSFILFSYFRIKGFYYSYCFAVKCKKKRLVSFAQDGSIYPRPPLK